MALHGGIEPTGGPVRELLRAVAGMPASDGDGVRLTRIIGGPDLDMLDPFLLLDAFESDRADDYIGGFPDHPHRGIETVTYLLAGRMRHRDNAGHAGVIKPGGVQWMSAGRGIIHSEMPEQEDGLLHGFQLWVNMPAADKMSAPDYQEYPADHIPTEDLPNGGSVRVIAGRTDAGTAGPIAREPVTPLYFDVEIMKGPDFHQTVPASHHACLYVISGSLAVGDQGQTLPARRLGILSEGDRISVAAGDDGSRFLLIAGRPLNEPVVRAGPFVMNTREQIMQAFLDYRDGRF